MTEAEPQQASPPELPMIQKVIAVLWPSFLTAGVATVLFFTTFDPQVLLADKSWGDISRLGAYTVGFFIFWLLTSVSCLLTCYFQRPCTPEGKQRRC